MRFILGPRQCGKTTLAKEQLKSKNCGDLYYNWDQRMIRDRYRADSHFFARELYDTPSPEDRRWVVMDEIHKFPRWKNVLKDFFDTYEKEAIFIVTGSARLDMFRKSGDSLAGRYFTFRLNPLTLRETIGAATAPSPGKEALGLIETALSKIQYHPDALSGLLEFSGFPEPFSTSSRRFHNKWRADYVDRVIREDLRDMTAVHEMENIASFMLLLPSRIGSPLSINSMAGDLHCAFATAANYLKILEKSYLVFKIRPHAGRIARALNKETKAYFYDWTRLDDPGPRFENYVAMEFKSLTELWTDSGEGQYEVRYVRTRDGLETDFLVLRENTPWLLAEAKLSRSPVDGHHLRHRQRLGGIPFVQIVREEGVTEKREKEVYQISASRFFG